MIGTYAAVLAVCVSSLAIGQAALALCGVRRWSWLAPAVGLALVCTLCWATVRMPGNGAVSAAAALALTVASALCLWIRSRRRAEAAPGRGRATGGRGEALRLGLPVALGALAAASLPFFAEGHFGILGTGFNPDMSQHLLATDRLVHGESSQLLVQGYPLGPHAVVAALNKGLGIGLVQGFSGLTMAAAVVAALTALAAFADRPARLRASAAAPTAAAALLIGLPYLVASYYAQGAFKEVIQALLVLAFALTLRESSRSWRALPLRYVPAALLAIGSVYVYSFPGLLWLGAIAVVFAFTESVRARGENASPPGGRALLATGPAARRASSLALIVFAVGALPELGRMLDFKRFETFDPTGPGLGNLFGQISPFTALGIWPSGDFRLAPGDGAVPAFAYYLGAAFASALLVYGLVRCWRRREAAVLSGLAGVAALYAAARLAGTPYTAAKALEIAAPILTLAIVMGLLAWRVSRQMDGKRANAVLLLGYLAAAGACSLLAFANAPVGPTSYSPALTGLRPLLANASVLVLAPDSLLAEEQGARYIAWELRGGRVCIEPASSAGGRPPPGIRFFVTSGPPRRPPFSQLSLRRRAGRYTLWERRGALGGPGPCPLISVRQARQGP